MPAPPSKYHQPHDNTPSSLKEKQDRIQATQLYQQTGSHEMVAREMGIGLKKAYRLIADELDGELDALRQASAEDLSSLQMHEYLGMKERLGKLLQEAEKAEAPAKVQVSLLKEIRNTLQAIDLHLEKTGKFVKREEYTFRWEDAKDNDPELQNLFQAMVDFLRIKGIEPQEFFDHVNNMMRDEAMARMGPVQDAEWEEVDEEEETGGETDDEEDGEANG